MATVRVQHTISKTINTLQHIKEVKLEPGEVMTSSYDFKTLFTSVPMGPSINKVKQKLQQDILLLQRTNMSIQQVVIASKTHTSSSKVSITNRSMVLPWIPLLAP